MSEDNGRGEERRVETAERRGGGKEGSEHFLYENLLTKEGGDAHLRGGGERDVWKLLGRGKGGRGKGGDGGWMYSLIGF